MKVDMFCLPDERNGYRLTTCSPSSAAVRAYTSAPWRGTKTPGISDGASVTKGEDTIRHRLGGRQVGAAAGSPASVLRIGNQHVIRIFKYSVKFRADRELKSRGFIWRPYFRGSRRALVDTTVLT